MFQSALTGIPLQPAEVSFAHSVPTKQSVCEGVQMSSSSNKYSEMLLAPECISSNMRIKSGGVHSAA